MGFENIKEHMLPKYNGEHCPCCGSRIIENCKVAVCERRFTNAGCLYIEYK